MDFPYTFFFFMTRYTSRLLSRLASTLTMRNRPKSALSPPRIHQNPLLGKPSIRTCRPVSKYRLREPLLLGSVRWIATDPHLLCRLWRKPDQTAADPLFRCLVLSVTSSLRRSS